MAEVKIYPRDFVMPPYTQCPKCEGGHFGVLAVHHHHYIRRCKGCWHTENHSLPEIKKEVLYLDQFVISNMMKAINPRMRAHRKGKVDPFYRTAFEKIDSLCKLQVVICPDSLMHSVESQVTPYYAELKRMYEALSHGATFHDPDTVSLSQVYEHARWWIRGCPGKFCPDLSPRSILDEPINVWQNRIRVSVEFTIEEDWIESLRKSRQSTYEAISGLFAQWQKEPDKDFDYWYRQELGGFGAAILERYISYFVKFAQVQSGLVEPTANNIVPPAAVMVIHTLHEMFKEEGIIEDALWAKTHEYFRSPTHEVMPFTQIASLLWASIARKAAAGQRRPPTRGTANDIDAISTLLPYCSAMFVDNECRSYLCEEPVRSRLAYDTKVFSPNTKAGFLDYLDTLRNEIPEHHLKLVEQVYGPDWGQPYTGMYEREQQI